MRYLFLCFFFTINMIKCFGRECECGTINFEFHRRQRIIGGYKYPPHKYPWLAAIYLNGGFLCGGTIISEYFVVSAAHCLRSGYDLNALKVTVGEHNRCRNDDNKVVLLSISKVIKHPHFNYVTYSSDIMLLKLSMKLTFNKYIKPICLPRNGLSREAFLEHLPQRATVLGWGKTTNVLNQLPSCLPHELPVPILYRYECGVKLPPSLFCAGYLKGGRDACQGDSGGPLQILDHKNRYELIGIVSNGIGCALEGHPGIYTDVVRLLSWIFKNTEGSYYCW